MKCRKRAEHNNHIQSLQTSFLLVRKKWLFSLFLIIKLIRPLNYFLKLEPRPIQIIFIISISVWSYNKGKISFSVNLILAQIYIILVFESFSCIEAWHRSSSWSIIRKDCNNKRAPKIKALTTVHYRLRCPLGRFLRQK